MDDPQTAPPPPPPPVVSAEDRPLRLAAAGGAAACVAAAYLLQGIIGPRGQAAVGVVAFLCVICACSYNLRRVNWRVVAWGMALQVGLALFTLKLEIGGVRPGFAFFSGVGAVVKKFLEFTNAGSQFVFGGLADPEAMSKVFPGGFVFAFSALPTIIFVSSFFTVLYYFGVLQLIVRFMAKVMMRVMGTSGAETLSAAANVFMGQTEAPLIVKPYVPSMTQSELLAMMVGGMATIAGGVMAVYISLGADAVAILTTSVMAAPCGLYIAKILLPELDEPKTRGEVRIQVERRHVNVIDAASSGATDGLALALNVAAMLIAFLASIALVDYVLGFVHADLSLARVFTWVFSPVAVLMGVPAKDVPLVADLLGTKLVANEFVSYVKLTSQYKDLLEPRSFALATFALTGFANFSSVGIQLGGIGGLAPSRRQDLARLGPRALLGGFVATLINASLAAMLW
jgi:CNT family concentrative nucleoside transporter